MPSDLLSRARELFSELEMVSDTAGRVELLNDLRVELARHSPFSSHPVDCVQWVRAVDVEANDYNPNSVAPPEMKLLKISIQADGYTQPIVTCREGASVTVVDGFHRARIGREDTEVSASCHGYLPVVSINHDREGRPDRIAATVRHNRARGKHAVDGMSSIVVELARRNWNDEKIGRELGMEADEVLRLKQVTGLAELFSGAEFSEAWEPKIS